MTARSVSKPGFRKEISMLYEFKSRATGTITMTDSVGRQVLEIIGKSPDPRRGRERSKP